MCRQPNTPMEYKHQELMNELNEFMISVKVHLHTQEFGRADGLLDRYAKPDIKYIDSLQRRINEVLQKDARPFVRY